MTAPQPVTVHPVTTDLGADSCACDSAWETAYNRFETPEEEISKFIDRLKWFGAAQWPSDAKLVELFCGRGGGLVALERLGFTSLEGVDLSESLVRQYQGTATCHVADCRQLPLPDAARDILIVQGGLHHLADIPADLERVLAEAHRVLAPGGSLIVVEPWLTPFLQVVHAACRRPLARRLWPKLDALNEMIVHEQETYEQWLAAPEAILSALHRRFTPVRQKIAWGKLFFHGRVPCS